MSDDELVGGGYSYFLTPANRFFAGNYFYTRISKSSFEWYYIDTDHALHTDNCHPKADGKFTADTYNSLVELTANICKRYNLNPLTDVIRHYDVTRKACPLWYVSHPTEWQDFKQDVQDL